MNEWIFLSKFFTSPSFVFESENLVYLQSSSNSSKTFGHSPEFLLILPPPFWIKSDHPIDLPLFPDFQFFVHFKTLFFFPFIIFIFSIFLSRWQTFFQNGSDPFCYSVSSYKRTLTDSPTHTYSHSLLHSLIHKHTHALTRTPKHKHTTHTHCLSHTHSSPLTSHPLSHTHFFFITYTLSFKKHSLL